MSLSGYEEAADEEEVTNTETSETATTPADTPKRGVIGTEQQDGEDEEFTVDSPTQVTGLQTTPKLPPSTTKRQDSGKRGQTARLGSSYRSPSPRKYTGKNPLALDAPGTPNQRPTTDLDSSPFEPESAFQNQPNHSNDPLMHRILDKNYRIQATPHTQRRDRPPAAASKSTPATTTKKALWNDSPQSSPEIAAPQLRSELFSPQRAMPRTPGISILTPARKTGASAMTTSTGRKLFSPEDKTYSASKDRTRRSQGFFDDDDTSDMGDDSLADMSPPKTMQFHVPQSRLVQTPAREASKRIVEDLLLTAGADATDDIEGMDDDEYSFEDPSPSVVRRALDVEDDTF